MQRTRSTASVGHRGTEHAVWVRDLPMAASRVSKGMSNSNRTTIQRTPIQPHATALRVETTANYAGSDAYSALDQRLPVPRHPFACKAHHIAEITTSGQARNESR